MSDPGTREDLLNFLSFYALVIYHVLQLEAINVFIKYRSFSILKIGALESPWKKLIHLVHRPVWPYIVSVGTAQPSFAA